MLRCPLTPPTLGGCIFRANLPAFGTPAPSLRCLADFGRVGGMARCARPDMSSLGGRASDATQRRAMAPFQVLPATPRRLLCAQTPHGWASYASWRHATNGTSPFGCPQPVWRAESRLTISLHAQQFAHSGCSSPTRSQARHKTSPCVPFASVICTFVRVLSRSAWLEGRLSTRFAILHAFTVAFSEKSSFFKTRAASAP